MYGRFRETSIRKYSVKVNSSILGLETRDYYRRNNQQPTRARRDQIIRLIALLRQIPKPPAAGSGEPDLNRDPTSRPPRGIRDGHHRVRSKNIVIPLTDLVFAPTGTPGGVDMSRSEEHFYFFWRLFRCL